MIRFKTVFQFLLIFALLCVHIKNNFAAEASVNLEQLCGFYAGIVEKAQSGNPALAISILSDIIKMDPIALKEQGVPTENVELNKFVALYFRGLVRLYEQGFYNEAIRDLNKAAEMSGIRQYENHPMLGIIKRFRSDALYMAGKFEGAVHDITDSIELSKRSVSNNSSVLPLSQLYASRGKYFSAEGKTHKALTDFMKAIELGSTLDSMFWGYAYELDRSNHNEKARFFFNKTKLNEITSDSKYLEKPISLKTKFFISKRIQSASKYIAIPEDLASTALLYSKAYLPEMGGRELTAEIQNILKMLGYDPGHIDGQFGPNTRSAIREFQKDYGIPVDGEPTEELYSRLKITIAGRVMETHKGGDLSIPKLVQQIIPAVVTVFSYGSDGRPEKLGSGFFVERSFIVTNFHVIKDAQLIKVKIYDGEFHNATVSYEDQSRDLAFIRADDQYAPKKKLSISKYPSQIGEKVIAIGNPMGFEQTVSDGIISGIRKVNRNLDLIQITAPISPGSSGGPVLNLRGEVIGVSTLIWTKGQSLNFAVSGKYVNEILKKND